MVADVERGIELKGFLCKQLTKRRSWTEVRPMRRRELLVVRVEGWARLRHHPGSCHGGGASHPGTGALEVRVDVDAPRGGLKYGTLPHYRLLPNQELSCLGHGSKDWNLQCTK